MEVRWTESALQQMVLVVDHLKEHRSARVATKVVDHLLHRVETLASLPWSAPEWRGAQDPNYRRLVVEEHVVLYRVDEPQGIVHVLAVRHGRQRPLDPEDIPPG